MSHIIVVGGGITGVTSAYALLRRGHQITVIDKHRYPAMETSYANGGQLSASNAEVWNNWATVLKGLKWMLSAEAPLLLNPTPSFHKYTWIAEFIAQIAKYRANTIETTRLAIAAREYLLEMAGAEGFDFDYRQKGLLHLYYDKRSFEVAAKANILLRKGGLDRYAVTPNEIATIEPTLHGRFQGGFYTPSDASGDIHKFTRGLADACTRRGATFILDTQVESVASTARSVQVQVRTAGAPSDVLEADGVVICAGVDSREFAASLGDRINIYPVKGYSITICLTGAESQAAAPNVCLLDEAAKIVTSRLGADRFRVAGTAEFNGFNKDIRADRIRPLVAWSQKLFPAMSTSAVIPWAGLRPMTPTMLPRVGPGRRPRVFYNTGHGHLGWTLSGATCQILADHVDRGLA
jgi:D-amino-acid dehydrogenase